jgi:hypothetical protein
MPPVSGARRAWAVVQDSAAFQPEPWRSDLLFSNGLIYGDYEEWTKTKWGWDEVGGEHPHETGEIVPAATATFYKPEFGEGIFETS